MKKNTTGDNFSFDFGGSDEFFPLDNAKSDKSQPPVGVKGYLKNVTKSVFGLGVKVHKHLLPELDTLVTSTKEDVGEISSEMSVKATIKNVKEKLKTYGKLGVDTGKSIFQDAKTAIKTGDFLGSDAVDDEFGDMFGDIGELSDGDSFDFGYGTDDSDDDYSSDDSSFPETGTTKAVIKSSYASTKAAAKMSNRQIATTVGAAQSQIKHQSLMFSQQMELSQYQHQAKMRVMRNIGINVGKLIDQNNISLKAQMEYSAKSLAFAQDTAAMTKEMRDALWLTVKPKETEEVQKTEKSKAFGSHGFNLKEYYKSVKSNLSSSDIGNMFETVKFGDEMLTMMLDLADGMGSSREKSFKDMLLPMIGTGIIDSLTGENLHKNKERLNKQIAGMPAMLNRMFGSMSEGGDNAITKAFEKIPFLNKHVDKVKSIGSLFHVEDQSRVITNRYSMGNPDEVHPFDNKAHHALTEVIPKFLARIDAGVNHTEEHYFDYKSNALRTVSSIKRSIENEREQVIEYSEGFNEASESSYKTIVEAIQRDINNLRSNDSALLKDGNVDNEKLNKLLKEMYESFMRSNLSLTDIDLQLMSEPGTSQSEQLFSHVNIDLTDDDKAFLVKEFVNSLMELKSVDPEAYRNLQMSANSYVTRLNSMYEEQEERYSRYGASSAYVNIMGSEQARITLEQNKVKIDKLREQIKKVGNPKHKKKLADQIKTLQDQNKYYEYETDGASGFMGIPGEGDGYGISSISDNSTQGIVGNIYRLLVDGINVFPQSGGRSEEGQRFLDESKFHFKRMDDKTYEKIEEDAKRDYELISDWDYDRGAKYTYFIYDEISKTMKPIGRFTTEEEFDSSQDILYIAKAQKYTLDTIENREYKNRMFDYNGFEKNKKRIPLLSGLKNMFNSVENFALGGAGDFLDKHIFGIDSGERIFDKDALKEELSSNLKKDKEADREQFKDIYDKVKGNKYTGGIVTKAEDTLASVKSEASKLKDKGNKYTGGVFNTIKIGNKPLNEVITDLKDVDLKQKLLSIKDPFDRINEVLNNDNPELIPFKGQLRGLRDKILADAAVKDIYDKVKGNKYAGGIVTKAEDTLAFVKSEASKLKDKAIKFVEPVFNTIKIGNKPLNEVITDLKDVDLKQKLLSIKDPFDRINEVLNNDNPELIPFKGQLRGLRDKILADAAVKGTTPSKLITTSVKKSVSSRLKSGALKILVPISRKLLSDELKIIRVGNRILSEELAKIDDPSLKKQLQLTNDPVEKANIMLKAAEQSATLAPFKGELRNFIESANDLNKTDLGSVGSFIKKTFNKNLNNLGNNKLNSLITGEFAKIEVNGKKLKDVLDDMSVKDPSFGADLTRCKDTMEAVRFLVAKDDELYPELAPFKSALREFDEKYKDIDNQGFKGVGAFITRKAKAKLDEKASKFLQGKLTKEFANITVDGVTLTEVLLKISENDKAFKEEISNCKDSLEAAYTILGKPDSVYPELAPYKAPIREFIDKNQGVFSGGMSGVKSFIANKVKRIFHDKVNRWIDKKLSKALGNITANGKTLSDVMEEMSKTDSVFKAEIEACENSVEIAQLLLHKDNKIYPELAPFKSQIREFIQKNENIAGKGIGGVGGMALSKGKKVAKSVVDWVKKKFGRKGDSESKDLKYLNKEIVKILGEDEAINVLDKAGLDYDELRSIGPDPVKQSEFLLENGGKAMKPYKSSLRKLIKLSKSKRKVRGTAKNKISKLISKYGKFTNIPGFSEMSEEEQKEIIAGNGDKYSDQLAKIESTKEKKLKRGRKKYDIFGNEEGRKEGSLSDQRKDKAEVEEAKRKVKGTAKNKISKLISKYGKFTHIPGFSEMSEEEQKEIIAGNGDKYSDQLAKIESTKEKKLKRGRKKYDIFGNEEGRKEGSLSDQRKDKAEVEEAKRQEKQTGYLKEMAAGISSLKKDGIGLDNKTLGEMDKSNEKVAQAAASAGGGGGVVSGFVDKMGLGGGKIGTAAKAVDGVIGVGKSIGGAWKAAGAVSGAAGLVTGGTGIAGAAAGGAGALAKTPGLLTKILTGLFKALKLPTKMIGNLVKGLMKGIKKIVGKVMAKITQLTGLSATAVGLLVPIATAVAAFGKGMLDAKKTFKIGKGGSITWGMRLTCGLVKALDGLLLGIPGLVATVFKKDIVSWMYEIVGSDEEKAMIARYEKYNTMRAKIFGAATPEGLAAYENRNGLDKVGRGIANTLTFGLVKGNDVADMKLLGFKEEKIYKYWKENKYKPLDELRKTVAEKFGGIKAVEKPLTIKIEDEDGDGEVDENERVQEEMAALQNQSAYRAEYLAEARKWVIENNLAWCSYKATIDQYEKYVEGKTSTGEETKPEKKTFAQKALGVAKTVLTHGSGIGLGLKVAKTFLDKTDVGKLIKSGAKKILDFTKNLYKKYNYNAKAKEVMDKAGDVIADTWTKADPDFYGQNKSAPDMANAPKYDANDIGDPTANLGGLSTGENFIYKVNDLRDRVKKVTSKPMEKLERIAEPSKKMLDKIVSTAKSGIIKNSASSDFSETFGKEIVTRLNILDEMHKENLRHNQVSEEFFAAALQMMSVIAQNSGNKQMSSVMTDMVKMVTQL